MENSDKLVCFKCLPDLKQAMHESADKETCGYCGKRSLCVEIADAARCIEIRLCEEYGDPGDHLPRDNEDGYMCGDTWDTTELMEHVGLECSDFDILVDLAKEIHNELWCEIDWAVLRPARRLILGWQEFKEVIRHKRRFTFWSMTKKRDPTDQDEIPPGKVLLELGSELCRVPIVKTIPVNTEIWRVRTHDLGKAPKGATDFGSPPANAVRRSNRMSPAGISMFYGSEDLDTADKETARDKRHSMRAGARFRTARPLRVLDLASLPPIPSFFAPTYGENGHALEFLHQFADEVSRPIDNKRGCSEVEYAATQVFTEHVRWNMKGPDKSKIDGIRYRSSVGRGACYVLFCEHRECTQGNDRWLDFDKKSIIRLRSRRAKKKKTSV